MGVKTDRPRNSGFRKEVQRITYAAKRLKELRSDGVKDDDAWDRIRAELKGGENMKEQP